MTSILIVDDSKFCRKLMRHPLENAGFRVIETEDPSEALAVMEDQEMPELLITDLKMPKLEDGLNFLMVVAMINDHLPVLVCSADQSNSYDLDNYGFKTMNFMPKPIKAETLLEHVRFLLR
jgi:chemosensory pili system protein ChpA (sensor histidine kinase/response regulator)